MADETPEDGSGFDRKQLEELIEEAIVDCYDEHEQFIGLFVKIEEDLQLPFTTRLPGLTVTVMAIEDDDDDIVVLCEGEGEGESYWISVLDLPLPSPPPKGAEWIAAYRLWASHRRSDDEEDGGS
ncbi:MAG: calcium-binding protein [Pseudomonadota bacterium]|nr:calcium-binding protein [Pseudomonadota bacterium]